ncbi:MAG: PspC domain-containing protein [Flavobacterium sp.]|nr:MAG: PspC domain-containing protein [Flavobacterium sp.]
MNKTVNINLGGMFFHIDEDAYQKLSRYFDAIKRSLSNSNGQDEIIKDIEMRIGELISERHTHDKQVINMKEIDEIIVIMGQPEDYRLEDDGENKTANDPLAFDQMKRRKKLYRDTEKGVFGGVCSGLGHYFGVDAVWIRIIFAILLFGFGVGFVSYIVLWIAMPAAVTTAEKLEMTGEPVTISNIEKKVREEFANVSDRFKNTDFDRMGRNAKTGAERFASGLGDVFSTIFKVFAKILGAIIVVFSSLALAGLVIGLFTLGSTSFFDVPWLNYAELVNYSGFPIWALVLLSFLAIGIPMFGLFILGLKLLFNHIKPINNVVKYTLLALWLISIGILSAFGIKQATETAFDGKSVQRETLNLNAADTVSIKLRFNDYYAKDVNGHHDYKLMQDDKNKEQIYSNDIRVHIMKSDDKTAYILIEKQAKGKSLIEAKQRAEKITYTYKIEGNQIVLDNYLLTEASNRLRDQEVEVFLYLPERTLVKPDSSLQDYDASDDGFFNLHYSGNYLYRIEKEKAKCLDCPANENEYGDVEGADQDSTATTTMTIDDDGIRIEKNGKEEVRKVKTLNISKDGIIVKTN